MSLSTDIELLTSAFGDIAVSCEHPHHTTEPEAHQDGNEHYMKVVAPCGHSNPNKLYVACWHWINYCRSLKIGMRCPHCNDVQPFDVANKVIGPVKEFM